MAVTITLAYYNTASITAVISFIVQAPESSTILAIKLNSRRVHHINIFLKTLTLFIRKLVWSSLVGLFQLRLTLVSNN
jgi:hypothetical protein